MRDLDKYLRQVRIDMMAPRKVDNRTAEHVHKLLSIVKVQRTVIRVQRREIRDLRSCLRHLRWVGLPQDVRRKMGTLGEALQTYDEDLQVHDEALEKVLTDGK